MIIKIAYYPDAEDDKDAQATTPKYMKFCEDAKDAEFYLETIVKHATAESDLAAEEIPF